jgi:hypothetical protein
MSSTIVSLVPALFVGAESARCPFANRRFTAGQRSGMTCGELQWLNRNNPQIKHLSISMLSAPWPLLFTTAVGEYLVVSRMAPLWVAKSTQNCSKACVKANMLLGHFTA